VPHASWVDFPVGLGARAVIGKKIVYLGKAELFKPPFGWLFKLWEECL
jgi:1-acyl-sn-glycerol-3-phosphate acyltransferase